MTSVWKHRDINRVVMIVNPTSGKGRGGKNAPLAIATLAQRGIQVVQVRGSSAAAATEAAQQALQQPTDAVIACGGDGTVHLALQLVAGTEMPLGIIPVGTGDDNARTLGLPVHDPVAAARIIADGHVRSVDAGHVTTADGTKRWFMGVMSSGFDSMVNERANTIKWPKGQARYLVSTVAELRTFQPLPYEIVIDGEVLHDTAMLVAVGNGVSYGGGMKVCPGALIDDGQFSLTFLGEIPKTTFLRVFPKVFQGTHVEHPQVRELSGVHIAIDAPGQMAYADGERVGPLPLHATCHPNAVQVLAVPVG